MKAGFGYDCGGEDLTRISNAWGNVDLVQGGTQYSTDYYPDATAGSSATDKTYSIFVQDAITIGSRVTINAGLLFNKDDFIPGDRHQRHVSELRLRRPGAAARLGVNFNVPKAPATKSTPTGVATTPSTRSRPRARWRRSGSTPLEDTIFSATTGASMDSPNAATTGKVLDPDMKPATQDEFRAVVTTPDVRQLGPRRLHVSRPEDVMEELPRVPPFDSFIYANVPDAKRTYKALVVDFNRRLWIVGRST